MRNKNGLSSVRVIDQSDAYLGVSKQIFIRGVLLNRILLTVSISGLYFYLFRADIDGVLGFWGFGVFVVVVVVVVFCRTSLLIS